MCLQHQSTYVVCAIGFCSSEVLKREKPNSVKGMEALMELRWNVRQADSDMLRHLSNKQSPQRKKQTQNHYHDILEPYHLYLIVFMCKPLPPLHSSSGKKHLLAMPCIKTCVSPYGP